MRKAMVLASEGCNQKTIKEAVLEVQNEIERDWAERIGETC
jgi:hypothetical protein